ncbi:MAG: site-2 protease family protein, partial [Candidatus Wildermuthbacteria bacterium]|nr:site-2 protease family protein [Candidatus Wildermuthbacteria bacterium]
LGHFFFAKKFGVRVEEFGIGLPPRLWGKKIGETLYSLNLLPAGAFVRMTGEEKRSDDPRSFSSKSLFQRVVIVAGGVIAFWVIGAFIFTVLGATSGIPMAVGDGDAVSNPQVQVVGVAPKGPAETAGLKTGDIVLGVTKISEVQELSKNFAGNELVLSIQRGKEVTQVTLVPREDPPEGQGPMGIALSRIAQVQYPWYKAPWEGIKITGTMTYRIVQELFLLLRGLAGGQGLPEGVQFTGPIGIVVLLNNALIFGLPHFLSFLAVLAIYLAIFNILPIPAVDGGRLLFLGLEFLRKKPLEESLEKRMIALSFGILLILFLWITVKDIANLF